MFVPIFFGKITLSPYDATSLLVLYSPQYYSSISTFTSDGHNNAYSDGDPAPNQHGYLDGGWSKPVKVLIGVAGTTVHSDGDPAPNQHGYLDGGQSKPVKVLMSILTPILLPVG
jgi:hypothetical protein